MESSPRLLLLAAADAARLVAALRVHNVVPGLVVSSPVRFAEALRAGVWDVVVASASAARPSEALRATAAVLPGLPVVVVAGAGDDTASLAEAGAAAVLAEADAHLVGAAVSRALRGPSPAPPSSPAPSTAAAPVPEPVLASEPPMPLTAAASDVPHLFSRDAGAVQALAEHLPIGLYQSTPDGRILFANEALADVLGIESVEALGRLDVRRDLGYPRGHFDEQVRRTGSVRNLVVRWTDRAGQTKYTRENARAVYDAEGDVSYYEGTMEDVTAEYEARQRERQRAERLGAIVQFATTADGATTTEAVYRAAIEAVTGTMGTPLAMLLVREGEETRCVAWSEALPDAAVALFNEEHIGALLPLHTQPILLRDERATQPESLPEAARAMMREHGVRSAGSFPLVHDGGVHGAFVVFYDAPHTFTDAELQVAETLAWHVAGSLARQRAESSLRDSETCLRFLAENTSHVLYRLRHEAGPPLVAFDYLSPAVESLVGFTPDELDERGGFSSLIEGASVLEGEGLFEGAGGEHYLARYRVKTRGGETIWVENSAYPWCDAEGRLVGLVGMLQDVTERKRYEDAQADEAARVLCQQRALVELGGLHAVGPKAVIRRAVELMASCTGADETGVWAEDAEATTLRCLDLYRHEDDTHAAEPAVPLEASRALLDELQRHRVLAVADTESSATLEWVGAAAYLRDRGVRAVLLAPVRRNGQATGVVALRQREPRAWSAAEQDFAAAVADLISLAYERQERRAAEAARHESEARYRAISELASDYAFAVHVDGAGEGHLAWATDAFARVTGYGAADIQRPRDLLAIVHPDSRDDAYEAFHAMKQGTDAERELRIVTREGEDRWVRHCARCTVQEETGDLVVYHSGQDVTERKQFERELIAAREAAVEMARLKSAFLANMSHEIRTPLTGILGYAGLLAEEVEGEQGEFVELIEKSGRRLLDTLNSVLELARLEANGVEPSLEVLDVAAEAREAVRLLTPLAEAKGLALTLEPAPADAIASLDRVCLGRILSNLIGNAVKFTEEGSVTVRVEVDDADVLVHIRDTGRGIAANFLPHLFDEFKQESEGHARSHEGAGLGLAITKRLTDLLGGAIAVECPTSGGTTFTVAFPRHLAPSSGDGAGSGLLSDPPLVQQAPAPRGPSEDAVADALAEPPASQGAPAFADEGVEPTDASDETDTLEAIGAQPYHFVAVPHRVDEAEGDLAEDATPEGQSAPPPAPSHSSPLRAFERTAPRAMTPGPVTPPDSPMPEPDPLPSGTLPEASHPLATAVPDLSASEPGGPDTDVPDTDEEDALLEVGPSVLVVEDNEDTRALLNRLLQRSYRVCAVPDALSALDLMNRERFDALILDINLGGKQTGIDVLRIARTITGYEGVFAVALTAYALPGDRDRFLEAGFDRYVSKPFTRATLMAALTDGVPVA